MPPPVRQALVKVGLTARCREHPADQHNDYLSWIGQAKRPETKQKRLAEMLDDLRCGDRYRGMLYNSGRKRKGS